MKTEVKINGKTVEIELTDEQIRQLQQPTFEQIVAEAKERYKGKGVKCLHGDANLNSLDEVREWDDRTYKCIVGYFVKGYGYGVIYHNGKWAEPIEPSEPRIPRSIEDVEGRDYLSSNFYSTKQRAEAMLALGQLFEIYAAIEQEEDGNRELRIWGAFDTCVTLYFETKELRDEFQELHKGLIETVEKGL